jgi:Tfp pilus assembly protein PilX
MNNSTLRQRQEGIALVVGLIFLLVMTMIGISSLSTTALEERMAGNLQHKTLAFQTSEAALARFFNDISQENSTISLSTSDTCSEEDPVDNPDINDQVVNETCSDYLATTDPGRITDTAFDSQQTSFVHFRINSFSKSSSNATVSLNQGMFRLGPNSPGVLLE